MKFKFCFIFSLCFSCRQVMSGSTPFTGRTSKRTWQTQICTVTRPSTCMPSGPPPWSTFCLLCSCWEAAASSCAFAYVVAPTLMTTYRFVSPRAPVYESNHRHLLSALCPSQTFCSTFLNTAAKAQNGNNDEYVFPFSFQVKWDVYSLSKSTWPYKYRNKYYIFIVILKTAYKWFLMLLRTPTQEFIRWLLLIYHMFSFHPLPWIDPDFCFDIAAFSWNAQPKYRKCGENDELLPI